MRDYDGDMNYFQNQLTKAGITEEECNMCDYCGLTFSELQHIVDYEIRKKKEKSN